MGKSAMANSVFKHQDDGGNLSIFASGDVVLLACEHGHYWVLDAKQHSSQTVKPALEQAMTSDGAEALMRVIS
jgi:hypothetical protein